MGNNRFAWWIKKGSLEANLGLCALQRCLGRMNHKNNAERNGKQKRTKSAPNLQNNNRKNKTANSNDDFGSIKTSDILSNLSSCTDRRNNSKDKQRRNVPTEAVLSSCESSEENNTSLIDEFRREFSQSNLTEISGYKFDPEKFFLPASQKNTGYFDRQVNAQKILDTMADYMNSYFNLDADPNPYSERRQKMDENLWDQMAFVIPVACKNVIDDVLKDEPLVVALMPNAVIFGDIHGNFTDIFYIFKNYITNKKYSSYKFVFLGDYVDRGPKSMEVVLFLITCKLVNPKRFFMLRGNHEVSKVNTKYGFKCMVETVYHNTFLKTKGLLPHLIYESFISVFNNLPVAAVIRFKDKKGIFCCHGGIPNEDFKSGEHSPWKISEINNYYPEFKPHNLVPRKNCPTAQCVLNEILWNDPIPKSIWQKRKNHSKLFYKNKKRGGHCSWFTEEALKRFLKANNLRLLIRGHQYKNTRERGFSYHFPDSEVLTVFSSSNYCGIEDNVTGCVVVTEGGGHSSDDNNDDIQPRVLRSIDESKHFRQFNAFELVVDDKNKKVIGVVY